MKTRIGLVLLLAAVSLAASIGQAFATGGTFGVDSNCPDGTYPVNCGPLVITLTSINGFSGTVILSATVDPTCTTGYCLTPIFNPTSVIVPAGGTNTSKLSFTHSCTRFPNCEWLVNITGTSGTLHNSTSVFVCYGRDCPI